MRPHIVLPAAGASSRMRGRDKLLEEIDGVPLLRRQAARATATGLPVTICLPPDTSRDTAVEGLGASVLWVEDAAEGMGATLRAAARALGRTPIVILLPDVPGVTTADIAAVLDLFETHAQTAAVRASDPAGRPGTPLALPARLAQQLTTLTGDDGGRSLLMDETVHLLRFEDDRATRDLDTPEDWAAWRS